MPIAIEPALLDAYNHGEITCREIAERIGQPVSFGALLLNLRKHALIRRLTERARRNDP